MVLNLPLKERKQQLIPVNVYKTIDITGEYVESGETEIVKRVLKMEVNGKCHFDNFLNESPKKVTGKKKILEELDAYITLLIQGEEVPPNKLHSIGSNEYEFRIKRTRVYFFFDPPSNNVIVLGHYNKTDDDQQDYIDKFREIKTNYQTQK